MADQPQWRLLVHGGAGVMHRASMTSAQEAGFRAGLNAALDAGAKILSHGGTALDAVEAAVCALEDDPQFNAGRGAVLTRDKQVELDASIMDGRSRKAGAVAQVRRSKNPIRAARLVMTTTHHVMIAGPDADRLADAASLEMVDPSYFVTPGRLKQLERTMRGETIATDRFGTVGAVALDAGGDVAAATSTGGMAGKMPGRIGDSPLIGAGTYADLRGAAVSCTGDGEAFIRIGVARMISARAELMGLSAQAVADATLAEAKAIGGTGGVIIIKADGDFALSFTTEGMFRGMADSEGKRMTGIFSPAKRTPPDIS